MPQSMPASDSLPKILGHVNTFTLLSRCPCEVAAAAKARLGIVCVGADANQRSHTANPFAKPDMMGNICELYMPIISEGSVPGSVSLKCRDWSEAIDDLKFMTNP